MLLIDGYNLLNAVGIVGRGHGGSSLERSRTALLNFLAESLGADESAGTTVVFDAKEAPPGLPRVIEHRGMTVRFAPRDQDADTLVEELIQADTAPKRLTVVSSDHRLHRAARRRKARAVDSDQWFRELIALRAARQSGPAPTVRPQVPLSETEILGWLEEFGGQDALEKMIAGGTALPDESPAAPKD
ncbi:MAG TPA: NYN domain-containing protein, partial [Thermoguttaceae bacterium]|nr:NYN domain-containing protein [Thermoguttaceae bacterium]